MYSANLVLDPGMAGVFRCKDCHMNFQSQSLLTKHKLKFCVGSTSDPDDLQLRRGFRSTSPRVIRSPDDRDDYRRNPNQDQQLRSLAENHGRHMEYLNLRNRDLEKQREDIRKQLENLGRKTVVPPPQDNTADLLRELREQEIRNQRALDDLKRQLQDLHGNQKVNVIEIEKPVYHQPPPPPPPPQPEPPKRSLVFPVYYGKSLVAEISAIRQAYLQNGGNDPDVLAQMSQMQAEAQAIEDQMNQKQEKSPREKPRDNDAQFRLLEMENDRLNQQLRLLQEQNLLAQNRKKSDKEGKEVHLHVSLPKSFFDAKSHKKRKVVRKRSPPPPEMKEQHLVGIVQQPEAVPSYNYPPQQPCYTVYNFPQEQPSVPMYSVPQPQPLQQQQQPQQQQQMFEMYPTAQQTQMMTYRERKPELDGRSFYSEPNRRSIEKVVRYTASHQPDGSIRILRSNSFVHSGHRHKHHVPPLDLRDLISPAGSKYKKRSKHYAKAHESESKVTSGKPEKYKANPFDRKLSYVSEGAEPGSHPPTGGAANKLPPIYAQEQGSRSGSQGQPRSEKDVQPQIYQYDSGYREDTPKDRPDSNQTIASQESEYVDKERYSPEEVEDSPVQDEIPDVAWQVKRQSPSEEKLYDYQY